MTIIVCIFDQMLFVSVDQVKCCKYWPDDSEMYGDIKITLLKTETLSEYTVRTFAMERVSPTILYLHIFYIESNPSYY